MCLSDCFCKRTVIANDILTAYDKIAIVVEGYKFVLMVEIILKLLV